MVEQTAADGATDGLTCVREGAAAIVTLSRPEKRNALTIAARARLAERLPEFARDPLVYAVVVRSTVDGTFCAGGDVVEMAALADRDMEAAEKALADEISLVWRAECFTKPTVSLIDGVVMGGGNGITRFGTHRIAGERYRFAMPVLHLRRDSLGRSPGLHRGSVERVSCRHSMLTTDWRLVGMRHVLRNEVVGWNEPATRMIPADERLETDQRLRVTVDDWLVMQGQLFTRDCLSERGDARQAFR